MLKINKNIYIHFKMSSALVSELDKILSELKEDDLAKMTPEKVLEMRKKINPYGRTIEGSDCYMNFSITQISHEYWKKFIITAFVGYLNRMCDEWKVPEGVPVIPVYEYLEDPSKIEAPAYAKEKEVKDVLVEFDFNKKWMEKRIIVKEFLEEMFQFNPDEHVRSAHVPNPADTSRKPINTMAGRLAAQHLAKTDKDFAVKARISKELADAGVLKNTGTTNAASSSASTPAPLTERTITKTIIGKDGQKKVITKKITDKVLSDENKADVTVDSTVKEMIPAQDLFGRFKIYYTTNYEQLRDSVNDLYCEKPELELAINPYSWHKSAEEAEAFKKKHRNEVIAEVFTAHSGKWNFFDTFKEQRDKVNFYNDNTVILEEMVKQLERDEKLGMDLMKKKVEKSKKENKVKYGEDDESFKKWKSQNTEIKKYGAVTTGDKADDECPDDAVQVDVWRLAKNGSTITKEKFYSQAEAPTHVKEAMDAAAAGMPVTIDMH